MYDLLKVEDIEAAVNVDKLDTVLVPCLFSKGSICGMKVGGNPN